MTAPRHIWLCADDYGISPGVGMAIRDLAVQGRLNATSVMVAAPSFDRGEAAALAMINSGTRRIAVGLHVTLTAPFRPLSAGLASRFKGVFPPVGRLLISSLLHRLSVDALAIEIATQARAFAERFGRPPDFLDGHQHVQLFPQVRDAFLSVAAQTAPTAWVRQCGRPPSVRASLTDPKALLLDVLSREFRRRAAQKGVRTNPAFAGTYTFASEADFSAIFPGFFDGMPDGGVVMCHPGFVDEALRQVDPLTTLREQEYAYLSSDAAAAVLTAKGVTLAAPGP